MVAGEEPYLDSGIHQVLERGEHPDIAPGHDIAVFIPEVPYVSEKIERGGPVRGDGLEEGDKPGLAVLHVADFQPQMHIGREI